ncbi:trafficking protein particle complex subunit 6A isoform X1 [Sagmatias obliquidens]|uniref:trafficking protein particle complex subunit 6A isoform X1 n=1 Tax=Sagmatias obliquidens TaxID=3371155 RepID=UPI000F440656|nr:trafficking protein particle complex subunit 6A isoform X1 [Lagenorhynchus obliquidens]
MRTRGAGRLLDREGRRMADAALFEFLHTEMVAELWAQDPDPGPGGQKMSLSVLEGMGFRVGQALGERLPRETLAFREELDALKFLCKDVWAAVFQKQMDSLRTNHQFPLGARAVPGPGGPLHGPGLQLLTTTLEGHAPSGAGHQARGRRPVGPRAALKDGPVTDHHGFEGRVLPDLSPAGLGPGSLLPLLASKACFPWGMPAWRRQPLTMSWSSGFEHFSRHPHSHGMQARWAGSISTLDREET